MTAKGLAVLALLVATVVLLLLLAFDLIKPTSWNPFYLAEALAWSAVGVHLLVRGPELN